MADTYTTRLRTLLMGTNSHINTWGADQNSKVFQLFDDAIAGWANIDLSSSNATLTTGDGAADEARMAVIRAYGSGTTTRTITIPSVEKCYKVKNDYGGQVLIKTAAGVGVTVLPNTQAEIFCNGTECYRAWVSGWGRLSNTAMTSGTSKNISFSVTGQAFARARLTCNFGISPAAIVQLTVNGPAGSSSAVNMTAPTTAVQGEIMINSLTSDLGAIRNNTAMVATSPGLTAATPTTLAFRMPGGITNVTLTSANAFNAGSILVDLQ